MKPQDHLSNPPLTGGSEVPNGVESRNLRLLPAIPEPWTWHFRALAGLRSRLMEDRGIQMAEAAEPIEVDTESADSATDEFDHDLALAMWESKDDMVQEVEAAIGRIRDGSYGLCEETGKVIPAARLLAMPWTRYTLEAEEKLETRGHKPGPRISKLHPFAPPGERDGDNPDEVDNGPAAEPPEPNGIATPSDDTP